VSVLVAILGLALLILVHEAGHFFTAISVGVRPRSFYIGFPLPALVKTQRNGIEYGIGAIPLGGLVKIPGMHRPAPSDLDLYFGGVQYEAPAVVGPVERMKRLLDQGRLEDARAELPELETAVHGAELAPTTSRAAERGLRELEDALGPYAYWRQRTWKRIAVIFAGPAANILTTIVLLVAVYMVGVPSEATQTVDRVTKATPAASMDLRRGDEIVAVNRQLTSSYRDVSRLIRASHGKPVLLSVLRHGRYVELGPRRTTRIQNHWALGFLVKTHTRRYGFLPATGRAFGSMWAVTKQLGTVVTHIAKPSNRKQISTPVGVVKASSEVARTSIVEYVGVLALISLSLALLNLLPLLPLDGGHIAFSIVEGIRGRAVGRAVYERVSAVGIALVLLLFFVGLSNDIGRLSGG
jgi:regulator of sigma E protease